MNITIDMEYVEGVIGGESFEQFLIIVSINYTILKYFIPWVATITVVINMMVAILCSIIYLKTKRRCHEPTFVFIGFLAIFDVLVAG